MDENRFGDYLRQLRVDLNLTQEELAERIGGTATQAEVSRLERGQISMPRRARLDDLAAALNVSVGDLLLHSGWLTAEEGDQVDEVLRPEQPAEEAEASELLVELMNIQEALIVLMDRIATIERLLRQQADDHTHPADPLSDRAFAHNRDHSQASL